MCFLAEHKVRGNCLLCTSRCHKLANKGVMMHLLVESKGPDRSMPWACHPGTA